MPDHKYHPMPKGTAPSGRTILAREGKLLDAPEPLDGAPEPGESAEKLTTRPPSKRVTPVRADGAEWAQDPATKALLHDAPCGGVVLNRQAGASLRRFCRECLREWHRTPGGCWVRVPEARGEGGRRG